MTFCIPFRSATWWMVWQRSATGKEAHWYDRHEKGIVMAEMALGYGSEYQLLRYLGHHRKYLNAQIQEVTGSNSPIEWMDYPVDDNRDSHDGEWRGIAFLKHLRSDYSSISKKWNEFWPKRGQSWDGIFVQDDVIYVVEAKAHIKEMEQACQASEASRKIIRKAFERVTKDAEKAKSWLDSNHYQLANRLAAVYFLNSIGIKAKVCCLFFVNGYQNNAAKNVTSEEQFKTACENEYKELNLTDEEKKYLVNVFIDAKTDGFRMNFLK